MDSRVSPDSERFESCVWVGMWGKGEDIPRGVWGFRILGIVRLGVLVYRLGYSEWGLQFKISYNTVLNEM